MPTAARRLQRRQEERERDPIAMDDYLRADPRFTTTVVNAPSEPQGAAYVKKNERTVEDAIPPAPPADAMPFDEVQRDVLAHLVNRIRDDWRNEIIRLKKEFASYRREWRFERRILNDQIALLRKQIDLDERGTVVNLPRGFIRRRDDNAA